MRPRAARCPAPRRRWRRSASATDTVQSLLTGNLAANAALKLGAFGLERWLDLEVGGYGSDPHEARSDLVAVARERAAEKYAPAVDTVLVGDTPLDVQRGARGGRARGGGGQRPLRRGRAARGRAPTHVLDGPRRHRGAWWPPSLPPLDAAAHRVGLRPRGLLAREQRRRAPRAARPRSRSGPCGRRPGAPRYRSRPRRRARTRPGWSSRRTRAPPPGSRRAGRESASRRRPPRARASPPGSRPDSALRRWG